MEWFGNTVDDRSIWADGNQRLTTPDGYVIPFSIENGLVLMAMRPPTDRELHELPHITLTSDEE